MSRTPIREALRRLQAQGLVEIIPHRGYVVVEVDHDDLVNIYEIRVALEGSPVGSPRSIEHERIWRSSKT